MTSPSLAPQALARLRELDPNGANRLLPRLVEAFFKSLERLLPELDRARGPTPDLATLRHVSHTLKSSAASLGAELLSRQCAEIEAMARNGQVAGLDERLDAMLEELARARTALADLIASV